MNVSVRHWLYLYVIDGQNYSQIARLFGTYRKRVSRAIQAEYKRVLEANGYKQLTAGKVKRLFRTADAGLILAYHQCNRCGSHHIKIIYDEGVPEGVCCGRCAHEISLMPSAASLRR